MWVSRPDSFGHVICSGWRNASNVLVADASAVLSTDWKCLALSACFCDIGDIVLFCLAIWTVKKKLTWKLFQSIFVYCGKLWSQISIGKFIVFQHSHLFLANVYIHLFVLLWFFFFNIFIYPPYISFSWYSVII